MALLGKTLGPRALLPLLLAEEGREVRAYLEMHRSIFTGRGVFRSGLDMFVVGLGVAAVGYFVGGWVSKLL